MKKNSIEKIYDFLSTDKETTLLVNQISDEIYCFYDFVIREFTNKLNIKINYNTDPNQIKISNELFEIKKVSIHNLNSIKRIEEFCYKDFKKIIFTDYKCYKKLLNQYTTINGYDFERDLKIFLDNYYNIDDKELINYCITKPYLMFSEISKYSINKVDYLADPIKRDNDNSILQIRKEIFNSKKSNINIKEFFFKLKKEALYKKFNFLVY